MDKLKNFFANPAVKYGLIGIAAFVKVYTPDEIDQLIDNALLVFLGYNSLSQSSNKDNA